MKRDNTITRCCAPACTASVGGGVVSDSIEPSEYGALHEETLEAIGWMRIDTGWLCRGHAASVFPERFNPDYVSETPRQDRFGRHLRPVRDPDRRPQGQDGEAGLIADESR